MWNIASLTWRHFLFCDCATPPPPSPLGQSQVVYAFANDCLAASLSGRAGNVEVESMVSTSELRVLKGDLLHKLAG